MYFSSSFNLLFHFMLLFSDRKDSLIRDWICISLFSRAIELCVRRCVRRAIFLLLCCYVLVVSTGHSFDVCYRLFIQRILFGLSAVCFKENLYVSEENNSSFPVDTGRKLNVHKTFRRCPGRLLNVLCTFNLHLCLLEG